MLGIVLISQAGLRLMGQILVCLGSSHLRNLSTQLSGKSLLNSGRGPTPSLDSVCLAHGLSQLPRSELPLAAPAPLCDFGESFLGPARAKAAPCPLPGQRFASHLTIRKLCFF